jgi:fatty-acyl-CoA synthase
MNMTLDAIVRRGAANFPERRALADARETWTWAMFDEQVNRTAVALRARGIAAGDRVAAADYNSCAYFALYHAVARVGAIIAPLSYLAAPAELEHVLHDFDPRFVLVGAPFAERFGEAVATAVPEAEVLTFDDFQTQVARADPNVQFPEPDPRAPFRVLYTSGTTGQPKGACHCQEALYLDGLMTAIGYRLTSADIYAVHAPSFHAASWDHAKVFLISDGNCVILPRFEPRALLGAIAAHRVTVLFGVPAVLRLLIDHPGFKDFDLSSVRLVYFGGALGAAEIFEDFADALGHEVDFMQIYGLTEGGPFVTVSPPETALIKLSSIGRPIPGVTVRIVDSETGLEVTDDGVGELCVKAPTLMLGYWRNPEATTLALRDGWLHTGDLARRDADGDFAIVDRLKDMVRSGGENIYAAEVERVLLLHPAVADVAVVGLPDARWDERVVAVVIAVEDAKLDAQGVRDHCREHLAAFKVPKQVEFMDALPRTGLGKVAKHVLRDQLLAREPAR